MVRVSFAEYMSRVLAVVLAASPREALERIVMAVALVVLTGWFLISGLPHALWALPWAMALVGTVSSVLDVAILALDDANFEDEEDGESDAGWELGA